MYDPSTARFLSKDPLEEAGGSPNPYLYCANDPVNNSDPSGNGEEAKLPVWFDQLSELKDGKKVVRRETWYDTFGTSYESEVLWGWLAGEGKEYVTEDQIRKAINGDPAYNSDALIAIYTAEGAFRRGPRDIQKYFAGFKTEKGTSIDLDKYGKSLQAVIYDYEKRRRVFSILDEPEEEPANPTAPPPAVAIAPAPERGLQQPGTANPAQSPNNEDYVKPYEYDYHFKNPAFVKVQSGRLPNFEQAAAETSAELIWNGEKAVLTSRGVEVSNHLADVMAVLNKRRHDLALAVPDLGKARYKQEAEEFKAIWEVMVRGYRGKTARAGSHIVATLDVPASATSFLPDCKLGGPCAKFNSIYLFSDQIDKLGERAYYLLRKMTGQVLDKAVKDMSALERLQTIWGLAVHSGRMNAAFAQKVESVLSDPAFYAIALAYAASHYIGVGEIVDVAFLALLAAKLGIDAVRIAGRMVIVFDAVRNAQNDADLDAAAAAFIDISLIAAGDVIAAAPARQLFRSFNSLRAELAAWRAGGPSVSGQIPAQGAASGGQSPTTGYTVPAGLPPKPGSGAPEPPGLAFLTKLPEAPKPIVEIPAPMRFPDLSVCPARPSVGIPTGIPPIAAVAVPATTVGTAPKPEPEPEPVPPPQPATAAADDDQNDKCKKLTTFSKGKGSNPLQSRYVTERRHVNLTTRDDDDPDLILSFEDEVAILKKWNMGHTEVRVPLEVYFRIDLTGDAVHLRPPGRSPSNPPKYVEKIPGTDGEGDTTQDREFQYIEVTGRGRLNGAIRDTGIHIIAATFGGKNTVGWLKDTAGWRSDDTNIFPGSQAVNDKFFTSGLEKKIRAVVAASGDRSVCVHVSLTYMDVALAPFTGSPVFQTPYPARPTSIKYLLHQRIDNKWESSEGVTPNTVNPPRPNRVKKP